jgi:anti-anti-sigma factor
MTKPLPERAEPTVTQLLAPAALTIRSEREDDMHTVALAGELDLSTADGARRELERAEAGDALSIVLDLSGLTFVDSTGVQLVLAAAARSRADGDRLVVLPGTPAVQRVFELCGVERLLPFARVGQRDTGRSASREARHA